MNDAVLPRRIEMLASSWLDGDAEPGEVDELGRLVSVDAASRRAFADLAAVDRLLVHAFFSEQDGATTPEAGPGDHTRGMHTVFKVMAAIAPPLPPLPVDEPATGTITQQIAVSCGRMRAAPVPPARLPRRGQPAPRAGAAQRRDHQALVPRSSAFRRAALRPGAAPAPGRRGAGGGTTRATRRVPAPPTTPRNRFVAGGVALGLALLGCLGLPMWSGGVGELDRADAGVVIVRDGQRLPASAGARLRAGDRLEAADGRNVHLHLADGSTLALRDGSLALAGRRAADQAQLMLRSGALTADVRPQPAGRPLIISTPTAAVEVVGTAFTLSQGGERTEIAMEHGAVRLSRRADGAAVMVRAGQQASVASDVALVARARSLDQGLVGHWTFDDQGAILDRTGNSPPGLVRGTKRFSAGVDGLALDLDARTFVEIPNASQRIRRTDSFAFAAWMRVAPGQDGHGDAVSMGDIYLLRAAPDGCFATCLFNTPGELVPGTPPGWKGTGIWSHRHLAANRWRHVLGQLTLARTLELHVDGELCSSVRIGGVVSYVLGDSLMFGCHGTHKPFKFVGQIDDVRIYDRTLEADEIRDLARGAPDRAASP